MVTIVTPESYDSPCAEVWVDPDLLDTDDDELAEQAAIDATWALWMLTGERFHGAQCWVEDYRPIHGYCNIKLRRFPVTEVVAVSRVDVCDTTIDPADVGELVSSWCFNGDDEVRVCCNGSGGGGNFFGMGGCGCPSGTTNSVVRVHYKVGNNLPPGAPAQAKRLAEEYVRASSGQTCSLPERVTSINRQGVSWTILDPQDFLKDGLTGIGPIDAWLAQVGLRSRWTTLTDPLRSVPRVSSTLVGCGDDACFVAIV
jgi:hypothetical protein